MSKDKIPYYQLRSVVEAMMLRVFEDETLCRGWKLEEFLEAYGTDLASRHDEETYDIAISAPPLLQ